MADDSDTSQPTTPLDRPWVAKKAITAEWMYVALPAPAWILLGYNAILVDEGVQPLCSGEGLRYRLDEDRPFGGPRRHATARTMEPSSPDGLRTRR